LSEFLARWNGLVWLLVLIGPLLFVQRRLHFELQAVFLLLTRRPGLALGLFSLLFLPGVLLHETSHYLMARLLGVRTGRFSLMPQLLPTGKLQLGFVETQQSDFLRDALIGLAPLLTGGLLITFLGLDRLGLGPLGAAFGAVDWPEFWRLLRALPSQPDFWLWFYLAFAISTTMLPSDSDRRAWLPVGLVLLGLIGVSLLAGAGPWLLENVAPWFNRGLRALSAVFGISLGIHLVLWLPLRLLRELICKMTGMKLTTTG
jgi:hypothetical protein